MAGHTGPALQGVSLSGPGRTGSSAPTRNSVGGDAYIAPPPVLLANLRRGDPRGRPREGKSAKRRQWRMKQAGFEEVPTDWRARQCPPIGRHNGGQESPAPTHRKSAGPPGPALPIFEYKMPRRVCRPQAAKNWDHFSPRHARGEKSLSGCQCGILPPCDKIMRAAACNPLGGKFRRNFRQFSPVI